VKYAIELTRHPRTGLGVPRVEDTLAVYPAVGAVPDRCVKEMR
jgi:hypothetical protein